MIPKIMLGKYYIYHIKVEPIRQVEIVVSITKACGKVKLSHSKWKAAYSGNIELILFNLIPNTHINMVTDIKREQ